MDDETKLSELEYFETLFGNALGQQAVRLREISLILAIASSLVSSFAFLLVIPKTYGNIPVPQSLLKHLPFYFAQYSELDRAELGSRVWWVMFVSTCFLAALTVFVLIWLTLTLTKDKRARIAFEGIPLANPPVLALPIMSFLFFSVLFTDLWETLILGGHKIVFGPSVFFLFFWCLSFWGAVFLIWHICFLLGMIFMKCLLRLR